MRDWNGSAQAKQKIPCACKKGAARAVEVQREVIIYDQERTSTDQLSESCLHNWGLLGPREPGPLLVQMFIHSVSKYLAGLIVKTWGKRRFGRNWPVWAWITQAIKMMWILTVSSYWHLTNPRWGKKKRNTGFTNSTMNFLKAKDMGVCVPSSQHKAQPVPDTQQKLDTGSSK